MKRREDFRSNRHSKPFVTHRQNCPFCENKTLIDYKDWEPLAKFITERGKLLSRTKTGICSRHQRQLTRAVKRARHVALLPFVVQV